MPGLLSSPVCLTVIWFLSLSLHPSCAQIWTDEVSGVQYGHLESNVTLACGKSQIRTPVVWHLNHSSALPWHKVTSNGTLVLLQVDHSAQGIYSCYDARGLLLHSVKLRLGHSPGLLSVSCQVPNHTHVRCSWVDSVRTFLPAQYNASFKGNSLEWRPCVVDVARKHCDVDHPAFWQTSHTLRVTETNALGSLITFHIVKLHKLLKPDPPESVSVKELEGYPKRLVVSWKFPSSWPQDDAFPLVFHIRYRPQGSMHWAEFYSEESPVVVLDALAGHLHQVQIQARDEVDAESQWSEWSPLLLMRPWEAYTTTTEPTEEPEGTFPEKPETSTAKTHNPVIEGEGNLGLVILLVLFSVVLLITVPSLIYVVWVRQRRSDHVTKQELTSMVKMKSMPI
ncbi:interleukin-11 receptor subunit alpha isoform X1 [Hippoglossus hippoglossus]|uniref:interleukin-11 receptor subunit alpha isoform X1 n=1 Tax=Hippoglossus hippoglossus TaxID=8267 RepID=UPI00148B65A6|nr:interleukin-11 receptor subunit alpha isoform X1 [Hippoglossus hippoglossus]XP_034457723.1 interleukin-11 receptor subunit alpha isoform X1 [Hippoglossus hippoglossus]